MRVIDCLWAPISRGFPPLERSSGQVVDQNTIVRSNHIADKLGDESVEQLSPKQSVVGPPDFPALILILNAEGGRAGLLIHGVDECLALFPFGHGVGRPGPDRLPHCPCIQGGHLRGHRFQ